MTMQVWQEYPKYMSHSDLPAVVAQSADEEGDYRSRGYTASQSDRAAYDRALAGAIPCYEPQPYQKLVGDKIVHSPEEEAALVGAPVATAAAQKTEAEELAEFRAWKAATPAAGRKTESEELAEIEAADRAPKRKHTAKVA